MIPIKLVNTSRASLVQPFLSSQPAPEIHTSLSYEEKSVLISVSVVSDIEDP